MLVERDFKSRYVGSMGGLAWSILNPLLQVAIYSLIFSLVFGRTILGAPFTLWLFAGLLPWITFAEVIKNSAGSLEKNRNLITKTPFPAEILSLVTIGTAFTAHVVGFLVLLGLLLVFHHPPGAAAATLPFYAVCLAAFSLGLSWLVAALNVFVRDTAQVMNLVLQLWFYLCPIIYPLSIIPESYRFLLRLNPLVFITEGYRRALIENRGIPLADMAYFLLVTFVFLVLGGWMFRRLKGQFPEVL